MSFELKILSKIQYFGVFGVNFIKKSQNLLIFIQKYGKNIMNGLILLFLNITRRLSGV